MIVPDRRALRAQAARLIAEAEALAPVKRGRLRASGEPPACGCGKCTGRPDWGDGELPPHQETLPLSVPPESNAYFTLPPPVEKCPVCEAPVTECVSPCVEAVRRELNERYPVIEPPEL